MASHKESGIPTVRAQQNFLIALCISAGNKPLIELCQMCSPQQYKMRSAEYPVSKPTSCVKGQLRL